MNRATRRALIRKHGYTKPQLDLVEELNDATEKAPADLTGDALHIWAGAYRDAVRLGDTDPAARRAAEAALANYHPEVLDA